MRELGPQLEHEGSHVDLEPGALERFESRLRRRQRNRKVGAYVLALFVFVGIVFVAVMFDTRRGAGPATPPPPSKVSSHAIVPPGMYWTPPLTRNQLVATLQAHGFGAHQVVRRFFKDLGPFSHTVRSTLR